MRFDDAVVFHSEAGTVDAAGAVEAFLLQAGRHGALVTLEAEVTAIRSRETEAEIELAGGARLRADAVVVAAGAWEASLLAGLVQLPVLTVTQQQIFHFPRLDAEAEPWPSVIDQDALIYHLAGGRDGGPREDRKIAEHMHGSVTTASGRSGEVDPGSRQRLVEYVKRRLPGLDPNPGREATCLYTRTASQDFILDRVGPLVICSACSGHGAKFAPLIGELAADLVTTPGRVEIPDRFRLSAHRR
jgi:sarcosine oxidase